MALRISPRSKEYLTAGRTLDELRSYEPEMRAAGFRKRRNAHGQAATTTREFFQWWDRKGTASKSARHAAGKCIRCGAAVARSQRGVSQWCRDHLVQYREYARSYYHEKLKPKRQQQLASSVNPHHST